VEPRADEPPKPLHMAAMWEAILDGSVSKRGVKIKMFGPVFRGFSPEIEPGTSFRSTGRPPDIDLHKKPAPETNSKAISRGIWGVGILGRGGGCTFEAHPDLFQGRKSAILGVWAAPRASEATSLGGGPCPPTF